MVLWSYYGRKNGIYHPSVFPSRCYLKKGVISFSINKHFEPGRTLNELFEGKKYFMKTHYHTHFYGNTHFLPPYHSPKNDTIKNDVFSFFRVLLSSVVKLKISLNKCVQKYYKTIFCCKIYNLFFIQKISRKLNFYNFSQK
jgi:hypothetical protein